MQEPVVDNSRRLPLIVCGALVMLVLAVLVVWQEFRKVPASRDHAKTESPPPPEYAGSQSCRECHLAAFDAWRNSHHALAERPIDPSADKAAFDPPREIKHVSQTSQARISDNKLEVVTRGADGDSKPRPAVRVIGVDPLRQFLTPADGGRLQVLELAITPKDNKWFDVFGNEDRQPGEWGHWSGRGMTWNSMCAACHNTDVRKNYRADSDSYQTTFVEHGVGCESCHGPLASHVAWQKQPEASRTGKKDPTLKKLSSEQTFSLCGSCHARRSDLTGTFRPGEEFFDHYSLTIPDETETYYADGQVHEEDFEFASFLGSRMHGQGVRCVNCHDGHSGKLKAPGNLMCLQCHLGKIDPAPHSHHPLGKGGSLCIDCHMPQTVYMQRHSRHDHGMTIPDPQLTSEFGVPNACNRCHTDKTIKWAADNVALWYGDKMNRHTQRRARWIAQARNPVGHSDAFADAAKGLLQFMREEKAPYWRAVAATLMNRYGTEQGVALALLAATKDPSPLVRAMAVRSLGNCVGLPGVNGVLQPLLQDSSRLVRVDAAWSLRSEVDLSSRPGRELMVFLDENADQPSGVMQMAVLKLERKEPDTALALLRKAVSWDGRSADLRHVLATALSTTGQRDEAATELEKGCKLDPKNPGLHFSLGLARGETEHYALAIEAFKKAVELDPHFARAWYNLALAASKIDRNREALEAVKRAEELDNLSPEIPYTRAVVEVNLGHLDEARSAAEQALKLNPAYREAARLLQMLPPKK
ncbi:MAG TPA: ammonia-forming cytochrome c nitrite reductase subunit c552 [Planctomycetota bacterium]|jgi:tetratricopeptide (TPR) repeat protein